MPYWLEVKAQALGLPNAPEVSFGVGPIANLKLVKKWKSDLGTALHNLNDDRGLGYMESITVEVNTRENPIPANDWTAQKAADRIGQMIPAPNPPEAA